MGTDLDDLARLLPDYEVGAEIGRGQFGVVWHAQHLQLGRPVAVKQLAGPVAANAEHAARFRREARILASLDHPHVVRVFDYREDGDLHLLVMELLTGGTFADRRPGLSRDDFVAAIVAAASGLHHVHEQGVLHRDVKPENLMLDGRGVLKVTDFGIARGETLHASALSVTRAGEFFGTPAYVAPEQAAVSFGGGWPPVGPAADQYSLAAVLYESLSGRLTHDASGGVVGLCTNRMNEEATPLLEVAPEVPPPIADAVMRALARDPAARFDSVADFAAALDPAGGSRTAPPPPAPRRRRAVAVGAALVVVVAVGGFVMSQRGASGGPGGDGVRPPVARITARWSFPTGGNVFASPVRAGDLIVIGSEDGAVYGLDRGSGSERWRVQTGGPVRASAAVAGEQVWVGSYDGTLYGIDAAAGTVTAEAAVGFEMVSSPAVADGLVVVGANGVHAFDAQSGAPRWHFPTDDVVVSSPTVAGDLVVVGSNDGNVYGIGLSDGVERWRAVTGADVQSSPAVVDGVAYVGSRDGRVYAIDAADGAVRWSRAVGAAVKSSPLVAGDQVIVGTDAGRLVSLDRTSGAEQWAATAGRTIDSSPAVAGDLVVVGSNDGTVATFALDSGRRQAWFETGGPVLSSPLVDGDLVVVGSQDDRVYALNGVAS